MALLCLTCGDKNSDGGKGSDNDGDGGTFTIDDPLFNELTETTAEWITDEWYTCEDELSACGLPCEPNDMWVAINESDFRESKTCSACM